MTSCRSLRNGTRVPPTPTPLKRHRPQPVPMWSKAIHNSQFPLATAIPSLCSRILNPKSCPTPRSILAYLHQFVKRHRVPFGPPREAFPRSMDGLPPPGRVPLVCLGARLARSPAREHVKKPIALTTETPRHREKALSFEFPVPQCLCGEKFVPKFFHIFRRRAGWRGA